MDREGLNQNTLWEAVRNKYPREEWRQRRNANNIYISPIKVWNILCGWDIWVGMELDSMMVGVYCLLMAINFKGIRKIATRNGYKLFLVVLPSNANLIWFIIVGNNNSNRLLVTTPCHLKGHLFPVLVSLLIPTLLFPLWLNCPPLLISQIHLFPKPSTLLCHPLCSFWNLPLFPRYTQFPIVIEFPGRVQENEPKGKVRGDY